VSFTRLFVIVRVDPPRHCEGNEVVAFSREEQRDVAGSNPENLVGEKTHREVVSSWVAASRDALLAMTNLALTLTSVRGDPVSSHGGERCAPPRSW
jgi:hypothetical protein